MIQLLTAIQTAFNANAALSSSFVNGLEVALGRDAESTPTCVLTIVSSSADYQTAAARDAGTGLPIRFYIEKVTLQFSVYSTNGTFCAQMLDQLINAFDHIPLSMSPDLWLDARRAEGLGRVTADDERISRGDILFQFTTQRPLGS